MIYSDKEKTKPVNIKQNDRGFYDLRGEGTYYAEGDLKEFRQEKPFLIMWHWEFIFINAYNNVTINASNKVIVFAYNNSIINAYPDTEVHAYNDAIVNVYPNEDALYGKIKVYGHDNATVHSRCGGFGDIRLYLHENSKAYMSENKQNYIISACERRFHEECKIKGA